VLVTLVLVVSSIYIIARLHIPIDGVGSKVENGKCIITTINDDSPGERAGLLQGDIILLVGKTPVTETGHMELLKPYRAGDTVSYSIIRDKNEFTVAVTFDSLWAENSWFYLAMYSLILIVSTSSLFILYRKPYDYSARIFFIYLQLLVIAQNFRLIFSDSPYTIFATIAFIISFNLFGIVLLHFHLIFPKPVSFYKRYKVILKALYLIGFVISVFVSILFIRNIFNASDETLSALNFISRWSLSWMGLSLVLAISTAIYQFFTLKNSLLRRQLRLVILGSAFGLATPIFYSLYPEVIWKIQHEQHLLTLLEFSNMIGTFIMTSFLAIAVFRYRIWNIEPFLRRAFFYAVSIIIIYSIFLLLLSFANYLIIPETREIHFVILFASMFFFLLIRDIIQRLIDRFFYRESYNSANVIADFEEMLAGIYNVEVLKSSIIKSVNYAFHFTTFVFAIKTENLSYKIIHVFGIDNSEIDKEFEISIEIDQLIRKVKIFSIEELKNKPAIFEISKGEIIVPLIDGKDPFGFFIIGPKRSEKSYSLQDVRLLSHLALRVISLFKTASLYQKDLEQQQMLESERKRIARDIHDDVGASLTRISMLSEMLKINISDPVKLKELLDQIFDTNREVKQEMTHIIWALNFKKDSLEGLIAYIRRFAFDFLEMTHVQCVFDFPEELPEIDLSVEFRRNIFLCLREALNNAVKHSGAKKIYISLKTIENGFVILVKDDGIGFDPDKQDIPCNGLVNMKKRLNDIGGTCSVLSKPGDGTEIELLIPTKNN